MIYFQVALTAVLIIALLYVFVFIRPKARAPHSKTLLCDYAHRGLHGNSIPENSLAAFELACKNGFGIELDVRLSADGEVMVFHDNDLKRMCGIDKKVSELTSTELQQLSLGDNEQKIPTFKQVLALINGRVPLLVELKGENLDSSLCPKVAQELEVYTGLYCIESFNPLLIRSIKKYLPDAFCGQLYTNVCRDKHKVTPLNIILTCMAFNFLAKPDFISYNQLDRKSLPVKISTQFYKAAKFVWTPKTDYDMNTAHELNECAIFENKALTL